MGFLDTLRSAYSAARRSAPQKLQDQLAAIERIVAEQSRLISDPVSADLDAAQGPVEPRAVRLSEDERPSLVPRGIAGQPVPVIRQTTVGGEPPLSGAPPSTVEYVGNLDSVASGSGLAPRLIEGFSPQDALDEPVGQATASSLARAAQARRGRTVTSLPDRVARVLRPQDLADQLDEILRAKGLSGLAGEPYPAPSSLLSLMNSGLLDPRNINKSPALQQAVERLAMRYGILPGQSIEQLSSDLRNAIATRSAGQVLDARASINNRDIQTDDKGRPLAGGRLNPEAPSAFPPEGYDAGIGAVPLEETYVPVVVTETNQRPLFEVQSRTANIRLVRNQPPRKAGDVVMEETPVLQLGNDGSLVLNTPAPRIRDGRPTFVRETVTRIVPHRMIGGQLLPTPKAGEFTVIGRRRGGSDGNQSAEEAVWVIPVSEGRFQVAEVTDEGVQSQVLDSNNLRRLMEKRGLERLSGPELSVAPRNIDESAALARGRQLFEVYSNPQDYAPVAVDAAVRDIDELGDFGNGALRNLALEQAGMRGGQDVVTKEGTTIRTGNAQNTGEAILQAVRLQSDPGDGTFSAQSRSVQDAANASQAVRDSATSLAVGATPRPQILRGLTTSTQAGFPYDPPGSTSYQLAAGGLESPEFTAGGIPVTTTADAVLDRARFMQSQWPQEPGLEQSLDRAAEGADFFVGPDGIASATMRPDLLAGMRAYSTPDSPVFNIDIEPATFADEFSRNARPSRPADISPRAEYVTADDLEAQAARELQRQRLGAVQHTIKLRARRRAALGLDPAGRNSDLPASEGFDALRDAELFASTNADFAGLPIEEQVDLVRMPTSELQSLNSDLISELGSSAPRQLQSTRSFTQDVRDYGVGAEVGVGSTDQTFGPYRLPRQTDSPSETAFGVGNERQLTAAVEQAASYHDDLHHLFQVIVGADSPDARVRALTADPVFKKMGRHGMVGLQARNQVLLAARAGNDDALEEGLSQSLAQRDKAVAQLKRVQEAGAISDDVSRMIALAQEQLPQRMTPAAMRRDAEARLKESQANADFLASLPRQGAAQVPLDDAQRIVREVAGLQGGDNLPLAFRNYDSRVGTDRELTQEKVDRIADLQTSIQVRTDGLRRARAEGSPDVASLEEALRADEAELKRLTDNIEADAEPTLRGSPQSRDSSGANQARLVERLVTGTAAQRLEAVRELFEDKVRGTDGLDVLATLERDGRLGNTASIIRWALERDRALAGNEGSLEALDASGTVKPAVALGDEGLDQLASQTAELVGRARARAVDSGGAPAALSSDLRLGGPSERDFVEMDEAGWKSALDGIDAASRREIDTTVRSGLPTAAEIKSATSEEDLRGILSRVNEAQERVSRLLAPATSDSTVAVRTPGTNGSPDSVSERPFISSGELARAGAALDRQTVQAASDFIGNEAERLRTLISLRARDIRKPSYTPLQQPTEIDPNAPPSPEAAELAARLDAGEIKPGSAFGDQSPSWSVSRDSSGRPVWKRRRGKSGDDISGQFDLESLINEQLDRRAAANVEASVPATSAAARLRTISDPSGAPLPGFEEEHAALSRISAGPAGAARSAVGGPTPALKSVVERPGRESAVTAPDGRGAFGRQGQAEFIQQQGFIPSGAIESAASDLARQVQSARAARTEYSGPRGPSAELKARAAAAEEAGRVRVMQNPARYTAIIPAGQRDSVVLGAAKRARRLELINKRLSELESDPNADYEAIRDLVKTRNELLVPAVKLDPKTRQVTFSFSDETDEVTGRLEPQKEVGDGEFEAPAIPYGYVAVDFGPDGTPTVRESNVIDRRGQEPRFESPSAEQASAPKPATTAAPAAAIGAGSASPGSAALTDQEVIDSVVRPKESSASSLQEIFPYDNQELEDVNPGLEDAIDDAESGVESSVDPAALSTPVPGRGRQAATREYEAEQARKSQKGKQGGKASKGGVTAKQAIAGTGAALAAFGTGSAINTAGLNALIGAGTAGGLGFAPMASAYGETAPAAAGGDINNSVEPAGSQVRQARRRLSYLTSQNPLPY